MCQSIKAILAILSLTALSGCIAKTVVGVVTAPVRVAGKAVDLATTSQSEADEKRGRAMRREDARLGRLDRSYRRHAKECREGDDDACDKAREERAELWREMDAGLPER